MLDFGDEITIDTSKVPLLIWIQILILLLLLILLYCFSIFSLDPSPTSTSSSSSSSGHLLVKRTAHPSQVRGRQAVKGEIATRSTIRRVVEVGNERDGDSSTTNTTINRSTSSIHYHPCHYFKLARLAFLKCLGLDPSESNSATENTKDR